MSAFLVGLVVGVLLMVMRVNAGYESGTNKENRMKNIKNKVIGTTRRGRIVRVAAVLVLVPALAFAVIMAMLGINGTVTTRALPTATWTSFGSLNSAGGGGTAAPVAVPDGSGLTSTATLSGTTNANLNITAADAYPGSSFDVAARVRPNATGLVLAGVTGIPNGVTVEVIKGWSHAGTGTTGASANATTLGCGQAVVAPPTESGVNSTSSAVGLRIKVSPDAPASVNLSNLKVALVPAAQYPAAEVTCTEVTR